MSEVFDLINSDDSFQELFSSLEGEEREMVKNYVSELSEKVEKLMNIYSAAAASPEQTKILWESLEDILKNEEAPDCQEEG